jgi:hypothetical protein
MSREHFHESQIEDRITELMQEGMSDEDAIQKAESEYDGQVNLVEEQALKIHERAYMINKADIQRKLKQGCYPSEILVSKLTTYLDRIASSTNHTIEVNLFCTETLDQIADWKKEIDNAE